MMKPEKKLPLNTCNLKVLTAGPGFNVRKKINQSTLKVGTRTLEVQHWVSACGIAKEAYC